MRKRSGGLHSQTQEQYLELAQKAQDRHGIFYNQSQKKDKKESDHKNKSKEYPERQKTFQGFDFNKQLVEIQEEDKEVNSVNSQITGPITVIICDNVEIVTEVFGQQMLICNEQKSEQQQPILHVGTFQKKKLDLVIRKVVVNKTVAKYWIMQKQFSKMPLANSYFKKADRIYELQMQNQNTRNFDRQIESSIIIFKQGQMQQKVKGIINTVQSIN